MVKKRPKHKHPEELNVVPLIDIMANLLFFLMVGMDLKEKQETGEQIDLPFSATKSQEEGNMVRLSVSADELLLEGVQMAQLKRGKFVKRDVDRSSDKKGSLTRLKADLEKRRKSIEQSGLDLTIDKNKPVVFLLAERTLDYESVEVVMRTAASAGFPRFRFGVLSR